VDFDDHGLPLLDRISSDGSAAGDSAGTRQSPTTSGANVSSDARPCSRLAVVKVGEGFDSWEESESDEENKEERKPPPQDSRPSGIRQALERGAIGDYIVSSRPHGKCRGGQGSIVVVTDKSGRDFFAAKLPRDERTRDEIRRELAVWSKLPHHPHVASLVNVGSCGPSRTPFHIVSLASHGNLDEYIRSRQAAAVPANALPPSPAEARESMLEPLDWCIQISRGIRFLHSLTEPIIHSDIKPANILVYDYDGHDVQMKICDLGLCVQARRTEDGEVIAKRYGSGTPYYRAPELMRKCSGTASEISLKVDTWGLGMCMMHAVRGDIPREWPKMHQPEDMASCEEVLSATCLDQSGAAQLVEHVDRQDPLHQALCRLVVACLRAQPIERPSMGACVDALLAMYTGLGEYQRVEPTPLPRQLRLVAMLRRQVLIQRKVDGDEAEADRLKQLLDEALAADARTREAKALGEQWRVRLALRGVIETQPGVESSLTSLMPPPPKQPCQAARQQGRYCGTHVRRESSSRAQQSSSVL